MLILVLIFGFLFAVFIVVAEYFDVTILIVLPIALGIVFFQYAIGPYLLDRIFKIRWADPASVDPKLAAFISSACQEHNLKQPRFGVIDDGNPNAFTYGHHRGDARLVITQGIFDLLDEEERNAVVAHEIGHIRNRDFIIMTLAAAVPIALYVIARAALQASRGRGKGKGYLALIGIISYIVYIVSHYIVLLLSRVREYYADEVSAKTTRKPGALSTALIKVAYGLARAPPREEDRPRDEQGMIRHEVGRELGIFDVRMARSLSLHAAAMGLGTSQEAMQDAMYWDLWNPWGRLYEISSTHPLPAKRIRRLSELDKQMGRTPKFVFDRRQPESYWDEFFVDLFVGYLPLLLPIFAIIGAVWLFRPWLSILRGFAIFFLFLGLGQLIKTCFQYRRGFRDRKVEDLVREIKVSPVRGIPVRLHGKIIGRGIPGLFWSDDLVLQDTTGFIVLDYHQPLGFLDFIFGIFKAKQFVGKEVEAVGWYRRAPAPYVELYWAKAQGLRSKCWTYPSKLFIGVFFAILGILLMVV
jgi:heat shock protein HtpX